MLRRSTIVQSSTSTSLQATSRSWYASPRCAASRLAITRHCRAQMSMVPIIRSWALTRGFALHPGTRNRYEIRDTRTQHRPASRQVNDHGRVSGTHKPQVGFSAARRSVSRRSSAEVDGRPGGRCGWVQCPTMRRRCQRNSVSGVTRHPARLGRASAAAIAPSKVRSASVSSGRSTCRRSTPSWWRNTMISRSFERRERTARRTSATKKRYIMRCTRSASARIAARQRPRPSFRHPHASRACLPRVSRCQLA